VNDTDPVGADPDAVVTVAVKRTSSPNFDVGTLLATPTLVAVAGTPPTRPRAPACE
jgi:hypothetical protein